MIMNELFTVVDNCKSLGGGYESPSVKLLFFQPEGVLCSSHEGFEYDESEDL